MGIMPKLEKLLNYIESIWVCIAVEDKEDMKQMFIPGLQGYWRPDAADKEAMAVTTGASNTVAVK